jgi:hypothetical protein
MSAPATSWRAHLGRWAHRAAAATAGALFDAAVDSLGLGKRCIAWLTHSSGARAIAVAAVALAIAGGAAWAAGRARRLQMGVSTKETVVRAANSFKNIGNPCDDD